MSGSNRPPARGPVALVLLGWIALALICLPSSALAGRAKEPGVLVVQAKGLAREKAIATRAVTEAVSRAGWTLAPRTFAPQETEELAKCLLADRPWACFAKTVRDDAIRRLALLSLESRVTADGHPMTVVTVMVASVEQQDVAYSGRRYCQACSPDLLARLTTAAAREVLEKMYLDSGRTFLQVKSRPAGALIEVDGKQMGVTDAAFEILPGAHRVVVTHPRYPPQTRLIEAQEDRTAIVTVAFGTDLAPGGSVDHRSPQARRSLLLPKAVVIAGAAVLAGGALALALDEDAPGSPPPLDEAPSQRYLNTAPLGAGLLIAGALVAGAGGWWWWHASRAPEPENKISAALMLQPSSATFSLTKSF